MNAVTLYCDAMPLNLEVALGPLGRDRGDRESDLVSVIPGLAVLNSSQLTYVSAFGSPSPRSNQTQTDVPSPISLGAAIHLVRSFRSARSWGHQTTLF
jgi:hypothetical protein